MPLFSKILKSQRGGKILIDDQGYLYNYLRDTGNGTTWACRAKYKHNCRTRIYYTGEVELKITDEHIHPPKLGEAESVEILRNLKDCASDCKKSVNKLIQSAVVETPDQIALPKRTSLDRMINRARAAAGKDSKDKDTQLLLDIQEAERILAELGTDSLVENMDTGDGAPTNIFEIIEQRTLLDKLVNDLREEQNKFEEANKDEDLIINVCDTNPNNEMLRTTEMIDTTKPPKSPDVVPPHIVEHFPKPEEKSEFVNIAPRPEHDPTNYNNNNNNPGGPPSVITLDVQNTANQNPLVFQRCGIDQDGQTIYFSNGLNHPYCRQCKQSFFTEESLDRHYELLHNCDLCKIAFCVEDHYTKHMELNHPDGTKSAWGSLCETCGRVFGVQFQLDNHRNKCSNRLALRCPKCFFSYGFEEDLKRHKETHKDLTRLRCNDCMRQFASEGGLSTHNQRKKTGQGPFVCTICCRFFCVKFAFTRHMKVHTDAIMAEKAKSPQQCKFCSKIFRNSVELSTHELTHLQDKILDNPKRIIKLEDMVDPIFEKESQKGPFIKLDDILETSNKLLAESNNIPSSSANYQGDEMTFMQGVVNEMECLINSM